MESIFIFTAGINENDLLLTVSSAYQKAKFPERVFFGIYEHRTDNNFVDVSLYKNVKKISVNYRSPLGVGLSRLSAFLLNENQKYCLQVDAHTIFESNWDLKIINEYNQIKKLYPNPIISTRPKWYSYDQQGNIQYNSTECGKLKIDHKKHFEICGNDIVEKNKKVFEHYLVSASFIFSEFKFFSDVLPDPKIHFYGDEHTTALRAVTRGYRIFAVKDCHVWTLGKNPEDRSLNNWKNIEIVRLTDNEPYSNFHKMPTDKDNVVRKILNGEVLGYWGAPSYDLYEEYVQMLGFDYRI
ncbi:MAG: hypothetical protein RL563_2882 [Pseudomonadota bacterium]|jgi:hypothetical protein